MFSIRWRHNVLVGTGKSVLAMANILEEKKVDFHIANVVTGPITQSQFGVGGFAWVEL